jgi:hypothetical protein
LNFDAIGLWLQFVLVNVLDLLRLNAKVIKGLPLGAVVETYHQPWNVHSERDSLVVTPGFPEAVTAVVPPEIYSTAPPLYQAMHRWDRQGASLTREQEIFVGIGS